MSFTAGTILISSTIFFWGVFHYFCIYNVQGFWFSNERRKLRAYFTNSPPGTLLETFNALFSFASCGLYIAQGYTNLDYLDPESFFTGFFIANYAFQLLIARSRWHYVLSFQAVIDALTCSPTIVDVFASGTGHDISFLRFYRTLKVMKVMRMTRLLAAVSWATSPVSDAVHAQVLGAMARALCFILVISGLVQVVSALEDEQGGWGNADPLALSGGLLFHDAVYYTFITISTIGYGDISPGAATGRLMMVVVVLIVVLVVPVETSSLGALLALRPKYGGALPVARAAGGLVVIGADPGGAAHAAAFLAEFFHPDHGLHGAHVVLVVPAEPDARWRALILQHAARDRLTYLRGDLRMAEDLARARAAQADAIFLLADRAAASGGGGDGGGGGGGEAGVGAVGGVEIKTFLRMMMCQEYCPDVKNVFVQVFKPQSIQLFIDAGIKKENILCLEVLRKRMLAAACLWEGLPAFISNLITSWSPSGKSGPDVPAWEQDYAAGLGKEIYSVHIGSFEGRSLRGLARGVYEAFGALLVAVVPAGRHEGSALYPGASYIIGKDDQAMLIADDISVVQKMDFYCAHHANHDNKPARFMRDPSFVAFGRALDEEEKKAAGGGAAPPDPTGGGALLGGGAPSPSPPLGRAMSTEGRNIFSDARLSFLTDPALAWGAGAAAAAAAAAAEDTLHDVEPLLEYLFSPHLEAIWPRKRVVLVSPELAVAAAPTGAGEQGGGSRRVSSHTSQRRAEELRRLARRRSVADDKFSLVGAKIAAPELRAAGAERAAMILVLSAPERGGGGGGGGEEGEEEGDGGGGGEDDYCSSDTEALAAFIEVKAAAPEARVVLELHDTTYMDQVAILSKPGFLRAAQIRGSITSCRDSFGEPPQGRFPLVRSMSGRFFDRSKSSKMAVGSPSGGSEDVGVGGGGGRGRSAARSGGGGPNDVAFHHVYAAGGVVLGRLSELLLCQAYFNPHVIQIVNLLLSASYQRDKNKSVFLAQIILPKELVEDILKREQNEENKGADKRASLSAGPTKTLTFGAVFKHLLSEYDALALGFFRPAMVAAPGHVATCPPSAAPVRPGDKIFIIGKVQHFSAQHNSASSVPTGHEEINNRSTTDKTNQSSSERLGWSSRLHGTEEGNAAGEAPVSSAAESNGGASKLPWAAAAFCHPQLPVGGGGEGGGGGGGEDEESGPLLDLLPPWPRRRRPGAGEPPTTPAAAAVPRRPAAAAAEGGLERRLARLEGQLGAVLEAVGALARRQEELFGGPSEGERGARGGPR